jgi:hypothetical protein
MGRYLASNIKLYVSREPAKGYSIVDPKYREQSNLKRNSERPTFLSIRRCSDVVCPVDFTEWYSNRFGMHIVV